MLPTERTKITRLAKRADYDEQSIHSIVDEALFCTLSFVRDGKPFAIPTGFCRVGNFIYIHGSVGSGYMRFIAPGMEVCISVALMDALVLAKSIFHHSVNYRSVVAFSKAELVSDENERMQALEAFTEKMIPGRWKDCRPPSEGEMRQTMILKFELNEASAKVRNAPPSDDEEDENLPYWSGLLHLENKVVRAEADESTQKTGIEYPGYFGL